MSYAFVSYSSKDREAVLKLAQDLQAAGCTLWLDQWNIVGRDPFWDEIQQGIEGCSHFLFVISPDSIERHSGALTELLHAASLQPPPIIVPVMVRETPYQKLPIIVSPGKYQIHDFTRQPYDETVARVSRALRSDALTTAPIERYLRSEHEAPTRAVPQMAKTKPPRAACSTSLLRLSITIAITAVAAAFVFIFNQGSAPGTSGLNFAPSTTNAIAPPGSNTGDSPSTALPATPTAALTPYPFETPTPDVYGVTPQACVDGLPSRLVIGQRARVTNGEPNRLNDRPARVASGATVLMILPAGVEFNLIGGPICADGLTWWQVLYGEQSGWTAEGENDVYWLEPAD